MIVDFGGYVPYQPTLAVPWHDMERRVARAEYKDVMARRHERIEQLEGLVGRHGLVLGSTDEALNELNDWYVDSVTRSDTEPERLSNVWYGVSFDIGLFLGEVMIERVPGLHWEFYVWGKRSLPYQRHVIMGFHNPKRRLHLDPQWAVSVAGHRAATRIGFDRTCFVDRVRVARKLWDEYPPSGDTTV